MQITSLYLHIGPAIVAWTLHWYPNSKFAGNLSADQCPGPLLFSSADEDGGSNWWLFHRLVLLPVLPYLAWAIMYYLKIFVLSATKIEQRGYATLFTYVTTYPKQMFYAIAKRLPPPLFAPAYFAVHLSLCSITATIGIICWCNKVVHSMLIIGLLGLSFWNGANYYFEVFAQRYYASSKDGVRPAHDSGVNGTKTGGKITSIIAASDQHCQSCGVQPPVAKAAT